MARMYASQQRFDVALGSLAPAMDDPTEVRVDCMAGQLMKRGLGREEEEDLAEAVRSVTGERRPLLVSI